MTNNDNLSIKIQDVPVSEIQVPSSFKVISEFKLDELMESISRSGLINPIMISDRKELISGFHRLEAFRRLGLDSIPCSVITEEDESKRLLLHYDENYCRNRLDNLSIGEILLLRAACLKKIGKLAVRGDNRFTMSRSAPGASLETNKKLEEHFQKSERSLQEYMELARELSDKSKDAYHEKIINHKEGLKLCKIEKEKQDQIIDLMNSSSPRKSFCSAFDLVTKAMPVSLLSCDHGEKTSDIQGDISLLNQKIALLYLPDCSFSLRYEDKKESLSKLQSILRNNMQNRSVFITVVNKNWLPIFSHYIMESGFRVGKLIDYCGPLVPDPVDPKEDSEFLSVAESQDLSVDGVYEGVDTPSKYYQIFEEKVYRHFPAHKIMIFAYKGLVDYKFCDFGDHYDYQSFENRKYDLDAKYDLVTEEKRWKQGDFYFFIEKAACRLRVKSVHFMPPECIGLACYDETMERENIDMLNKNLPRIYKENLDVVYRENESKRIQVIMDLNPFYDNIHQKLEFIFGQEQCRLKDTYNKMLPAR